MITTAISNVIYGTVVPHTYLDYHWVGGVTSSTASVKITLNPTVADDADELYSLSLVLIETKTDKVEKEMWL